MKFQTGNGHTRTVTAVNHFRSGVTLTDTTTHRTITFDSFGERLQFALDVIKHGMTHIPQDLDRKPDA